MAIQTRRGNYGDFDPQKMLPGEWATTISGDPNAKDGRGVYMCFAAGDVKRMATYEDMKDNVLEASEDVIKEVAEGLSSELTDATDNANTATQKATQAAQGAKQAKADADSAAKSANDAAELANKAAENVKNDYYGSYDSFPEPGQTNKLYIDNTVTPAKQYIWNGNEYILAGGGGGDVNAESVSYDNASSGLAANTVQGAIDENAADIKAINASKLDDINTRTTNNLNDIFNQQLNFSVVIRTIQLNADNSPDGSASGFVISFRDSERWGNQFAVMNGVLFSRQNKNGVWQSWLQH